MSGAQRLTLEARLHAVAGDIAIPDRAVAEFDGGGSGYPVSTGRVGRRGCVSWTIRPPRYPDGYWWPPRARYGAWAGDVARSPDRQCPTGGVRGDAIRLGLGFRVVSPLVSVSPP